MKHTLSTSLVGLSSSLLAQYSIDDLNQIIQIIVQMIIGLVTIYKLLKQNKNGK